MKRGALAALLLLAAWSMPACTAENVGSREPGAQSAAPPSASRLTRMNERFSRADTDGSGALSRREAESVPRLARSFDAIDANRDDQVSREEFLAWRKLNQREACRAAPEKCLARTTARLTERFNQADSDRNGALSRLEAEKAMPGIARRFDALDANRDGQVTVDEVVAARRARLERQGRAL